MDQWHIIALLAGIIVTGTFTWVRTLVAAGRETRDRERDKQDKEIARARWEGSVTEQLSVVRDAAKVGAAALERIENRLDHLPCGSCTPKEAA